MLSTSARIQGVILSVVLALSVGYATVLASTTSQSSHSAITSAALSDGPTSPFPPIPPPTGNFALADGPTSPFPPIPPPTGGNVAIG